MLQSVQASHIRVLQMFLSQRQITLSYKHRSYKYLVQEKTMSEQKQWTFKVEDIFEDIPDDPKNVIMKIPDEIAKQVGIDPGGCSKKYYGETKAVFVIQKLDKTEETWQRVTMY